MRVRTYYLFNKSGARLAGAHGTLHEDTEEKRRDFEEAGTSTSCVQTPDPALRQYYGDFTD